jgi:hypothetical protein
LKNIIHTIKERNNHFFKQKHMASFIEKLKTIEDRVRHLLINYEWMRDDTRALTVAIWGSEMNEKKIGRRDVDFLTAYSLGKLTNEETIQRSRRKLQEQHVELRGKMYNQRKHQEQEVRDEFSGKFRQLDIF